MTTTTPSPVHVARKKAAEQEGDFAGREYQNLRDDMTLDGDTWQEVIAYVQENPYDTNEDGLQESELLALRNVWQIAFDQGAHAQEAVNRRAGTVTP